MSAQDDAIVDEFLADSQEGLDRLDQDLVGLEADPRSAPLLASAFRTLHTIKGTCSFLGFHRLERIAHAGEHLLARLRSGERTLDCAVTEALLACVDVVRRILAGIAETRHEPAGDDHELIARLEALANTATAKPATAIADASAARPATTIADAGFSRPEASAPDNPTDEVKSPTIRVQTLMLDSLVDLVGELVLARNQLRQCLEQHDRSLVLASSKRLDQVTSRLQEEAMRTRMQPVSSLWTRLPRLVRDVASACGKDVRLEMSGHHTELDRTLLDALRDPLVHLVRNAIDHGIETPAARRALGKTAHGTVHIAAHHEGGEVHLEIRDDGAGLAHERIRDRALERGLLNRETAAALGERECVELIFLPGFSTAERVTNVSGRGVGMDIVRTAVERLGGRIEVRTSAGAGTTFRIRIPLTLAILPALIVEDRGERYAVPQAHLVELVRASAAELPSRLEWIHDLPVHRLRDRLLPVVPLTSALHGLRERDAVPARGALLVLRAVDRTFGLLVENVLDTEEIVVKPLSPRLRGLGTFAGATVRGDGRVALILDVAALARRAGLDAHAEPAVSAALPAAPRGHAWLCVTTVAGDPAAIPLAQVTRIEEADGAAFEAPAGRLALRWREHVLPIRVLGSAQAAPQLDPAHRYCVLIHRDANGWAGVLVHALEDIVETRQAASAGARIVLRERITDVHDLHDLHDHKPLAEAA